MDLIKDTNESVRGWVVYALGEIGPEAKAAIPLLAKSLKDKDEYTLRWAAEALGKMGSEAEDRGPCPHRIAQGQG